MKNVITVVVFVLGITIGVIFVPQAADAGHRGVPHGAILMFERACPSGYSGVSGLNSGRFPRGAGTPRYVGGSNSHTHSIPTALRDHTHPLPEHSHNASSFSNFLETGYADSRSFGSGARFDLAGYDESGAYHDHNVSGKTGAVTGESTYSWEKEPEQFIPSTVGVTSHLPPYYEVKFCTPT